MNTETTPLDELFRKEMERLNRELKQALENCIFQTRRCMQSEPPVARRMMKFLIMLQTVLIFVSPLGACIASAGALIVLGSHFLYMRNCRRDLKRYGEMLAALEKEMEAQATHPQ